MTIPRNLSFLAEGASSTGVLGTANGGTGLNTLGTAGQALVVNSGATGLTYSTPSAGAMSLISTQTASSSASLQWTGLSGYNSYLIIIDSLKFSATGNTFLLQMGSGSGPTWITSGYIQQGSNQNQSTTITGVYGNGTFSGWDLYVSLSGVGTTTSLLNSNITISNVSNSSYKNVFFQSVDTYNGGSAIGNTGNLSNTSVITAFRIIPSASANIVSGTASLYGISS